MSDIPVNPSEPIDPKEIIKKTSADLSRITARLRSEAEDVKEQARKLDRTADKIEDVNKNFWNAPTLINLNPSNFPLSMGTSGATISFFADYLDKRPVGEIQKKEIVDFIDPSGDLIEDMAASTSAAIRSSSSSCSGPSGPTGAIYVKKIEPDKDRISKAFVAENLQTPELKSSFLEAWDCFDLNTKDPHRSASLQMREVVRRFLDHEAPDKAIVDSGMPLEKPGRPKRAEQTEFILTPYKGTGIEEVLREAFKNLRDLYSDFSKAHKPGSMADERLETREYLIQATRSMEIYLRNKR